MTGTTLGGVEAASSPSPFINGWEMRFARRDLNWEAAFFLRGVEVELIVAEN